MVKPSHIIALFLVPALFVGGFLLYGKIKGKPFRPASPWETSAKTVDAKMEGVTFHIPGNHLRSLLELSDRKPDELANGFMVHALMPDFLPFSYEHKDDFIAEGQANKVVYVSIGRMCRVGPRSIDAKPCTATSSLQSLFKVYAQSLAPVAEEKRPDNQDVPGMEHLGTRVSTLEAKAGELEKDIFAVNQGSAQAKLLICSRTDRVPNPQCTLKYIWRDKFLISISFARAMKDDWALIREKADHFFTSVSEWPEEAT
ncbi:hypothetical protein [Kordiimonas sp.]|uniref:hypothetical protein n=1 Tax=Kordiimonas sp. TaxID=1970157 RepID=UPI003A8E8DE9